MERAVPIIHPPLNMPLPPRSPTGHPAFHPTPFLARLQSVLHLPEHAAAIAVKRHGLRDARPSVAARRLFGAARREVADLGFFRKATAHPGHSEAHSRLCLYLVAHTMYGTCRPASVSEPSAAASRSFSSFAALFVNVMTSTELGAALRSSITCWTRATTTRVLPLPGPALTRTVSDLSHRTAARCSALRPSAARCGRC